MHPKLKRTLNNLKRTAGNVNLRNDRAAKRQRTGNNINIHTVCIPKIPSIRVSPLPKGILLSPSRQYSVEIEGLGQMTYKDGWFRQEGRPRTDLGLQDGRFITNAKVIIRNPEGEQIFCSGGGTYQVISLQLNKNSDDGSKTVTVLVVQDRDNLVYRFPTPPLEMKVDRNETVNVYGLRNVTITAGQGGHVVHNGIGYVLVKGNVQSVTSHGAGMIRVDGNVEEGLSLGSTTKVTIAGDVRGDIKANGVCSLHVFGRHLGTGKLNKAWFAKVRISEEDWDWDRREENEKEKKIKERNEQAKAEMQMCQMKNMKVIATQKENKKDEGKTGYDDWEEIKMDVISSDDEDENGNFDFYS